MSDTPAKGSDLVMTQAELPPGIDVPPPGPGQVRADAGESTPLDVVRDIRQLADRVGGLDRLRDLIDEIAAARE